MKIFKIHIISPICGLIIFSCTREDVKDVSPNTVYQQYEVFYNKNTNKTQVLAVFRFNNALGTNLKLSSPSDIKFNNDTLVYDALLAMYKREYNGSVTGVFTFTDADKKVYSNSLSEIYQVDYPTMDTVNSTQNYTFNWVGSPISGEEVVSISVDGTTQFNFEYFEQREGGKTNIVFLQERLALLGKGSAVANMERLWGKNISESTKAGGRITSRFKAMDKLFYIK